MAINIHGKNYIEVKDRVLQFRAEHPEWSITTSVVNIGENNSILISASVLDETDRVRATGLAHEFQADKTSMVNSTSWVENCETSAIGRALASLGYGIEEAYASANEVQSAKAKQAEGHIASSPKKPKSWKFEEVPAGKNAGKPLGELSEKQLLWYIENWETQGAFRQALDSAKSSMQKKPEPVPEPVPEEQERPEEDEDVPF